MNKLQNQTMTMGCGLQILIFTIYIAIGTWSSSAVLSWFNKDIPFIGDVVIGIVIGSITVPVAIVGSVLRMFGIF